MQKMIDIVLLQRLARQDPLSRLLRQGLDSVDEPRQEQISLGRRLQRVLRRLGEAGQVAVVLHCGQECRVRTQPLHF